jgi:two-component system nitrate/nitrite response regulator NarP
MGPPTKLIRKLSGRERQVAVLIWQKLTYRQIAEQLKISPGTVTQYAQRVFQRLDLRGRTKLEAMRDDEAAPD